MKDAKLLSFEEKTILILNQDERGIVHESIFESHTHYALNPQCCQNPGLKWSQKTVKRGWSKCICYTEQSMQ